MRRLSACARDESGSVLVIAALVMSVIILLGALAIDSGTWFTHKRQLQNRVDAAAFAAGLEYAKSWRDCLGNDAAKRAIAAAAIEDVARQYSGDPAYSGTIYNNDVVPLTNLGVAINSPSFGNSSNNDSAGGPCVAHPADAISPAGSYWTDVKAKETSATAFFGFGIAAPNITSQARVALAPELSETGFSPLAVPVPHVASAQLRLFNVCTGALLGGPYNLTELGSAGQTVPGMSLWGRPNASGDNQPLSVNLPTATGCNDDYVRIGEELRVSGKAGIDLTATGCVNIQFVSCWTDIGGRWGPEVRAWKNTDPVTGPPLFKDVHIGNGACAPDVSFSRIPTCNASGVSVDVDWGDRDDGNKGVSGNFTVKVSDGTNPPVTLNPPGAATPSGVWTSNSSSLALPATGNRTFTISWSWDDETSGHAWRGNDCAAGGRPCRFVNNNQRVDAQHGFVADDTNSDIVQLAKLTNSPDVSSTASEFDSVQANGNPVLVYATFGFSAMTAPGSFTRLRAATSQSSGSINCNNGNQGSDFSMLKNGCTPFYGVNGFTPGTWWTGTPPKCPAPTNFPATSTPTNPWRCAPAAPGLSPSVIADGIAAHTGNCSLNNSGSGCSGTPSCVNRNLYVPGTLPSTSDPRLITVFIVPYGSFVGVNGGSTSVPVIDFGRFYVTAWGGNNASNTDPCPDNLVGIQPGEIDGRFVDLAPQGNPDPNGVCDLNQLRPCLATLVY